MFANFISEHQPFSLKDIHQAYLMAHSYFIDMFIEHCIDVCLFHIMTEMLMLVMLRILLQSTTELTQKCFPEYLAPARST